MRRSVLVGIAAALGAVLCLGRMTVGHAEETMSFQILQPLADQQIHGDTLPLVIAFQSTENAPVVRFDAYLDSSTWLVGGRIKNPIPAGSFRVDASLTDVKIKPGVHTLYVKLFDSQGRMVQQERNVDVEPLAYTQLTPEKNPPKVQITSPHPGDVISAKTKITVSATDDSGVKYVIIYVNKQIRAWMNEAPFMISWDPIGEKMKSGTVTLSAHAMDLFDNEGISDEVVVTVTNPNDPNNWRTGLGVETANKLPAVADTPFPIVIPSLPSLGATTPPITQPNVKPISDTVADISGAQLPSLTTAGRNYDLSAAGGDAVALLPVKSLPGAQETLALQGLSATGVTAAPALAAAGSALRPGVAFGGPAALSHEPLVAPSATTAAAPRGGVSGDTPVLLAYLPTFNKDVPGRTLTLLATDVAPADGVAVFIATPDAGSALQRLGVTGATQPLGLRLSPATLTVNPLTGERTLGAATPTLLALLPSLSKQIPGLEARSDIGYVPEMTLPTAIVPHTGGSSSRIDNSVTTFTTPDHGVVQTSTVTLEGAAPRTTLYALVPQPTVSTYAAKGLPGRTAQPEVLELVPAAVQQTGVTPTAASTADRPVSGYTGVRIAMGVSAPAIAAFTAARTVSSEMPTVSVSTPAKATPGASPAATDTTPPQLVNASGVTPNAAFTAFRPEPGYTNVHTAAGAAAAPTALPFVLASRTVGSDAPILVALLPTPTKSVPGAELRTELNSSPVYAAHPALLAPGNGGSAPLPNRTAGTTPSAPASVQMIDIDAPHMVKAHETWVEIAKAYNTTPEELIKMNPGLSPERPMPGTVVKVPHDKARLYVDDTPITAGPTPYETNGYTMVPIRFIVEAKGGIVVWLPATHEVNAWANHTFLHVQVGQRAARINGTNVTLPVAATLREARTMVPLRYMMSALNMQMEYNPASGTYSLISRAP